MSKTKILLTGSCGFIFSNFVRYILHEHSKKYSIVSIDKITNPNTLNAIYVNKGHQLYIGDVADDHFVNLVFEIERPDIVIHGAAESFVDKSIKEPQAFIHSNVLGTQVIIDAYLKWNVKRLVYISTDEIYGALQNENDPSWTEESPMSPRNAYSASKACGELLVKAAHNTHGLQYNITRSCNNFGPRQPRRNLIPVIIGNILDGLPVPIYGDGMHIRDWIYVLDNCSAILKIIEEGKPNEIYNISAGQEFTNIEIFHEICNALGTGHNLLTHVEDRKGHDRRYSITNNKIKSLGWEPKYKPLKDMLKFTCSWYCNNKWSIKKG